MAKADDQKKPAKKHSTCHTQGMTHHLQPDGAGDTSSGSLITSAFLPQPRVPCGHHSKCLWLEGCVSWAGILRKLFKLLQTSLALQPTSSPEALMSLCPPHLGHKTSALATHSHALVWRAERVEHLIGSFWLTVMPEEVVACWRDGQPLFMVARPTGWQHARCGEPTCDTHPTHPIFWVGMSTIRWVGGWLLKHNYLYFVW